MSAERVVTLAEVERLERENAEMLEVLAELDYHASQHPGYEGSPLMARVRAIIDRQEVVWDGCRKPGPIIVDGEVVSGDW